MPRELPKAYDPSKIEDQWAASWVEQGLFHVESSAVEPGSTPFTQLLPPPNVTGRLHMGHMLNQTEMDIMARWKRMQGFVSLWVPGTDHAGIATQMMVERQLAEEKKTRQELGRDAFIERVWAWKQHYGGAILDQMKRLGASVDWSREYFTMDDGLSRAVREAFVKLYEQGLIYRGEYIVNWCPGCQTAISDLEVVHEEQQGSLWEIRYEVVERPGEFLTIATTRPETMLGDVAVAVHPEDERYTHLHGLHLRLPLIGREIPLVTDAWVSREFGTGAVKITPAHDPNDFELGKRHGLRTITVMDEKAHMNAEAGVYAGLYRFAARKRIVEDLEAVGALVAVKPHTNAVGRCDRSKDIVEPRLSKQWFVRIQPLADTAIEVVEKGHVRFTPAQYAKTYFEWMRNIHDWCISRQLWWGHRIPAWHCKQCGSITVARETPQACTQCGDANLEQETDVLDTWFSSGLLPFTVFGWPDRTPDLNTFYPTQLLVTGFDILFFWVARMIMLGCHFMKDVPMPDGSPRPLSETVPFQQVYIHALVRDADRQKMSKTKGNVVDPIEVVTKYGTDAVRFTLASMASPGTDIAFNEARTEGYRAFANKIWNAARFLFMNMERATEAGIQVDVAEAVATLAKPLPAGASLDERWILSRLAGTIEAVNSSLTAYRFDEAANVVYQFFWGEVCDWYLETAKLRLDFEGNLIEAKQALMTLVAVFEAALRLLSPFMPFLTEELWHALYDGKQPQKSIALTRYPVVAAELENKEAEQQMASLQELIVTVRALRKEAGVEEKLAVPVQVRAQAGLAQAIPANQEMVKKLARIESIELTSDAPQGAAVRSRPEFDVALVYERKVDVAAERERLNKELLKYRKGLESAARQLGNEGFLAKAPAHIVEGLKQQQTEMSALAGKTEAALLALAEN